MAETQPLTGRVAIVAGATRGAGRGIARGLGEAGATVYCTGRSTRGQPATPNRPECIEETAELVAAAGGAGVAVRVDHTDEHAVRDLIAKVRAEQGRLDILVNDIWGGDDLTQWGKPFWELDVAQGLVLLERAVHTHIITSRHAVPLMLEGGSGLVVEITDGDHLGYRSNLFYDLAKLNTTRLAYAMACDLRGRAVTALAVTPGFLRSEAMLERHGVTERNWRDAKDPHFLQSETPWYVGRAVAALAADPNVHAKNGAVWATWTLMHEYGFTDVDGSRPDWGGYFSGLIRTLLERGEPYSADELFLLLARRYELDFDVARRAERERIAALLARSTEAIAAHPGAAAPA
jgi:NAD(P)-dependent dehydrogenase (short-subunit alcohol dehydrogenase family)